MLLIVIGLAGGIASGLLGIGGGIIMVPLLAYVAGLPFHTATSISIVQVLAVSISGIYTHYRLRSVSPRVGILMGVSSASTAAIFSVLSPAISSAFLQIAFFVLLVASAGLLLLPKREPTAGERVDPPAIAVVTLGLAAGAVAGTLGAGGGFFMIPLMIYGLGLGTRVAIGTSLVAIFFGSLASALTKLATGQIDAAIAIYVVAGGVAGALVGARLSYKLATRTLRLLLFALLAVIALRTLVGIVGVGS